MVTFSNKIKQECTISYADIDGFPVSTNKMHAGRFIFGYIENKPIVLMDGRIRLLRRIYNGTGCHPY